MESVVQNLFLFADRAVRGTPGLALSATFLWGILSILLSPCHLSSIPLVVAVVGGRGNLPFSKAVLLSSVFASGILVTLGVVTALSFMVGFSALQAFGPWGTIVVALLFLFGALTLWGFPLFSILNRFFFIRSPGSRTYSWTGIFSLGLIFGLSLGPCTLGFMMPVLGAAGNLATEKPFLAGGILGFFALGHCGFIAFAGGSFNLVSRLLKWNESTRAMDATKKVLAIILGLIGFALLYEPIKSLIT